MYGCVAPVFVHGVRPMATVLIADDAPRVRQLLGVVLRGAGHKVEEVADGDAALAAIRGRRPAVAVLDVVMPGRSGLEVCRQVRADPALADVRVLLVSANATAAEAAAAGAAAFLAKPFSPANLRAVVDDLVARGVRAAAVRPLRAWRAERLLSIRQLARLADVAPSTIYLTEAGRTTPHPSVMRRIAAALGVDAHEVAEFRRAIEAHAGRAR